MSAQINLMPKGFKEPKNLFKTKFFWLSIGCLIFAIILFFLFFALTILVSKKKASLDDQLASISQVIEGSSDLDDGLDFKKLSKIKSLLDNHLYWSRIFPEIEKLTLPQISFNNFSGRVENDQAKITFSGNAINFKELARQIASFETSNLFKEVNFSSQGSSEGGGVDFQISLSLPLERLKKLN